MELTSKEIKYLEKILASSSDIHLEVILNTLNRKRDDVDKLSVTDITSFIESKGDNSNKHLIKRGEELQQSEVLDKAANNALFITSHVISELETAISYLIQPKSPTKYKILSAKTQAVLDQEVNKYIKMGWQPLGGVSAAAFGISPVGGNQYIQAMVKY